MDLTPFLAMSGPFLCDVYHGQIQHFKKAVIGGKDRFCFRDLLQLTIKSLNGIGCVNQAADSLRILEIG